MPSEDLTDEVEAINSIYGEGTLALTGAAAAKTGTKASGGDVAILAVPKALDDVADDAASLGHRLSLRVVFPPGYPSGPDPPDVLGVVSVGDSGSGRPGEAARDVERFRLAVVTTFGPGLVCLFDAVEEFLRLKQEERENEEAAGGGDDEDDEEEDYEEGTYQSQRRVEEESLTLTTMAPPPWTIAEPLIELKSVFVARCAPVTSPAQADAYVQYLLATDRRVRSATHNMTAWRIRHDPGDDGKKAAVVFQDCDDDGETAAGGRLLHLMQLMDLWNVMVVVTRWYGGHKLGPRRFALINQSARDAFVRAGLVPEPAKKKGHGK